MLEIYGLGDGDGCLELLQGTLTGQLQVLGPGQLPGCLRAHCSVQMNMQLNLKWSNKRIFLYFIITSQSHLSDSHSRVYESQKRVQHVKYLKESASRFTTKTKSVPRYNQLALVSSYSYNLVRNFQVSIKHQKLTTTTWPRLDRAWLHLLREGGGGADPLKRQEL